MAREPFAIADELDFHLFAHPAQADAVAQIVGAFNGLAIDADDHVVGADVRVFGVRAFHHFRDEGAAGFIQLQALRQVWRHVPNDDAELAAPHFAVVEQLRHHRGDHPGGHGEADADAAAG